MLAEAGWTGAAITTEHGGSGSGDLLLALIAEELARSLAAVPYSSCVYVAAEALKLAGSEEQKARMLPGIAAGTRIGTLAVPSAPDRSDLAARARKSGTGSSSA